MVNFTVWGLEDLGFFSQVIRILSQVMLLLLHLRNVNVEIIRQVTYSFFTDDFLDNKEVSLPCFSLASKWSPLMMETEEFHTNLRREHILMSS